LADELRWSGFYTQDERIKLMRARRG